MGIEMVNGWVLYSGISLVCGNYLRCWPEGLDIEDTLLG